MDVTIYWRCVEESYFLPTYLFDYDNLVEVRSVSIKPIFIQIQDSNHLSFLHSSSLAKRKKTSKEKERIPLSKPSFFISKQPQLQLLFLLVTMDILLNPQCWCALSCCRKLTSTLYQSPQRCTQS